jgi:hypothetical protein
MPYHRLSLSCTALPLGARRRRSAWVILAAVVALASACSEETSSGSGEEADTGSTNRDTGASTQVDGTTSDDTSDSGGGDAGPTPCNVGSECLISGVCVGGFCADPTCQDNIPNADETGVDCGGPTCDPCGGNQRCDGNVDCLSQECVQGLCTSPPLRVGDPCAENAQCASDRCEAFGADPQKICTSDCDGTCDGVNVSCFRSQCVPITYCDDPDGDGIGAGPGCTGTICQTCDRNATCVEGADAEFTCACNTGYQGSGISCADLNECNDPSLHDCHPTWGGCQNTVGDYLCECLPGFSGDGRDCADVNECDTGTNPCGVHLCNNNAGNFYCACAPGYTGDYPDCVDVDECADNPTLCGTGTCTNSLGAYTCACPQGYSFRDGTCADINECTENPNICGLTAQCANNDGGYACACLDGYRYQNTQCIDVNECADNPTLCGPGTCNNSPGAYTCACDPGYAFVGGTCADIDACSSPTLNDCSADATCADLPGTYTCTCNAGFSGDGTVCADDDECADGTDNCSADATCTNTTGSFTCACNAGFTGDGLTCADDDECADGTDNCAADATCANTPGAFTCTCDSGFTGDGTVCDDINECADPASNPCLDGTCNNNAGDYTCACPTGYAATAAPAPRCLPLSCAALLALHPTTTSGVQELLAGGASSMAYCDMSTDGGGWTLVLKVDGRTQTLGYDAPLWIDNATLNPTSTDVNARVNAKFAAFSNVAFTEVLIGMEQPIAASGPLTLRTLKITKPVASVGTSLRALLAGANDQLVSATRANWLTLLPSASLQPECNKGGFNVIGSDPTRINDHARMRIGFIANQETDCDTPDSRLGVGGAGASCATTDDTTAGNVAGCMPSAGPNSDIPTFSVVFVR